MFRLYIRQFQSITWRNNNNQFYSVALNRNNFCTTPVSDEDSKGEKTEPKVGINVSELLETGDSSKKILAAKACDAIISMAQLKRDSSIIEADYKNDARFLNLIKTLESHHVNKVETLSIISSLKGLSELGIPDDSFVVKNLENSLIWNTRNCPIKDLVFLLSFSSGRRNTENQNKLFVEVCKSLERRWVEIKGTSPLIVQAPADNFWILLNKDHFNTLVASGKSFDKPLLLTDIQDGKIFSSLLYYSDQFSPQFLAKLEDRISDVAEEISPGDMVLILNQLARTKRRNVPLLKTLCFYICKFKNMLDIKQISDCLFALNRLSFKDQGTAEKLCDELVHHIEKVETTPVLRSILTSLGQLKYLHNSLLDSILTWYSAGIGAGSEERRVMSSKDMTTIVITLATLNHAPVQHSALLEHVSQQLKNVSDTLPEHVWLDTVWSLTVLGKVTSEQLESVLNPVFYNVILYNSSNKQIGATLKLLNINAAAKQLYKDYKGPTLNVTEDALMKDIKVSPGLAKVQFNQSVLEAFSTLCPPPRLSSLNVNTLLGFVAEADVVLDSRGQPLLVQEFSNSFGNSQPQKPLPEGGHRLSLITATFQECLLGGQLSGVTSLNAKLLQSLGYKVMVVNYTDWQVSDKLVTRVKHLDDKMKKLIEIPSKKTE